MKGMAVYACLGNGRAGRLGWRGQRQHGRGVRRRRQQRRNMRRQVLARQRLAQLPRLKRGHATTGAQLLLQHASIPKRPEQCWACSLDIDAVHLILLGPPHSSCRAEALVLAFYLSDK